MRVIMKEETALPFGLKDSDLKYPKHPLKYDWKKPQPWQVLHTFTLHLTDRFGWVISTLHIRNPGRRHRADAQPRTYAVDSSGAVVTVGIGPHIKRTITVYVKRSRADALKKIIDLHTRGMADAGNVRDRISTRRAQTTLRRGWRGSMPLW